MSWQKKVDELTQAVVAMEAEREEMVEKLSKAKQEGVKVSLTKS